MLRAAFGADAEGADAALHRSQHAVYQADVALALARKLKKNPCEVATAIAAKLPVDDTIAKAEVSGPGFINLTIGNAHLNTGFETRTESGSAPKYNRPADST